MKTGPFTIQPTDGKPASGKPAAIDAIGYLAAPDATGEPSVLVLAHGAGAGQRHPYMVGTAERLCARGVSVVTFDFPYMQNGKKLPDKGDVLEACFAAAFSAVLESCARGRSRGGGASGAPTAVFAGGKSMGGRIASQAAAKRGIEPRALVFLGYPLHPPGKPAQLRDAHLPAVRARMLFVQGTRDVFGTADELRPLVRKLGTPGSPGAGSALYVVEGGDHSHAVPKRGAVPQDEALAAIADAIVGFLAHSSDTRAQKR